MHRNELVGQAKSRLAGGKVGWGGITLFGIMKNKPCPPNTALGPTWGRGYPAPLYQKSSSEPDRVCHHLLPPTSHRYHFICENASGCVLGRGRAVQRGDPCDALNVQRPTVRGLTLRPERVRVVTAILGLLCLHPVQNSSLVLEQLRLDLRDTEPREPESQWMCSGGSWDREWRDGLCDCGVGASPSNIAYITPIGCCSSTAVPKNGKDNRTSPPVKLYHALVLQATL